MVLDACLAADRHRHSSLSSSIQHPSPIFKVVSFRLLLLHFTEQRRPILLAIHTILKPTWNLLLPFLSSSRSRFRLFSLCNVTRVPLWQPCSLEETTYQVFRQQLHHLHLRQVTIFPVSHHQLHPLLVLLHLLATTIVDQLLEVIGSAIQRRRLHFLNLCGILMDVHPTSTNVMSTYALPTCMWQWWKILLSQEFL